MGIYIKGEGGLSDSNDGGGGGFEKPRGREGEGGAAEGFFEGVEHGKKRGFVLVCFVLDELS